MHSYGEPATAKWDLEGVEFLLHQPQAGAENKATFADVIDHRHFFGHLQGMVKRQLHDARADLGLLGPRGQCGGKREWRGQIASRHLVMLGEEKGFDPHPLS